MSFTTENIDEMDVLMLFNAPSGLEGIKIHKSADARMVAAAQHLFNSGFTTQIDGGYLTALGIDAAEHAHSLYSLLNSGSDAA
jgi:uncharacterized protein (TIGR02647 family)